MKISAIWLAPLAFLYGIATRFRNYLYNIGYSRSFNYDIMVIVVGNLSVGGTGKSPMTEYLIRLLHQKYSLATLSRGYKRKTKGFLIADEYSGVRELGDEPYQMYLKFKKVATIAVGEERTIAIPNILLEHPETQVVIMDDGYQHRAVRADLGVLLTDFSHPFYNDHLLPWGRLREVKAGAKRAKAIIVTKCPSGITQESMDSISEQIKAHAGANMPVFFSRILFTKPKALFNSSSNGTNRFLAFSGLANAESFNNHVKSKYEIVDTVEFDDHHYYTEDEVQKLLSQAVSHNASLLTTEKDIVKFRDKNLAKLVANINLYYLSIEHQFVKDGNVFDEMITDAITEKYTTEEE